jgi:hypothetical protein
MYRIQICLDNHEIIGRQDRELDFDLFCLIITGQHPQGDGQAHSNDSNQHGGQNRTCYYHAIWNPITFSWITTVDLDQASALYQQCQQESFSG